VTCPICGKGASNSYCDFHGTASDNLVKAYKEWREAMNIEWEEYLKIIAENPNTGMWAVEVARDLLKREERRPPV